MTARIERDALGSLFGSLQRRGFAVVGPTVSEGAIIYSEISSPDELPVGWTDRQEAGTYRLEKRSDQACFGYVVGPQSWKKFLHPPLLRLFSAKMSAKKSEDGFAITGEGEQVRPHALLGVRACELAAIAIQDKVFLGGPIVEPNYQARRQSLFIVAVNCTHAGGTCFCTSMKTGPRVGAGFDLALTEVLQNGEHYFLVESGSPRGEEVLRELPQREANPNECDAANHAIAEAEAHMGRSLDTHGLKEMLFANLEHPRWDYAGKRCLSCANCTMVCPTCFCVTVEDVTSLNGQETTRVRKWDSCFSQDFSYIHGGSIRRLVSARYRQWLTHKLASWVEQFGTFGCVGCGRCITWCPVGIDLTEEVKALRASPNGEHQKQS